MPMPLIFLGRTIAIPQATFRAYGDQYGCGLHLGPREIPKAQVSERVHKLEMKDVDEKVKSSCAFEGGG